jgi:hypothetical protein
MCAFLSSFSEVDVPQWNGTAGQLLKELNAAGFYHRKRNCGATRNGAPFGTPLLQA